MKNKTKRGIFQKILILALIAVILVCVRLLPVNEWVKAVLDKLSGLGFAGMLIYVGLYITACLFLIPGSILTLGAGAVYGVVAGSVLVSVSSVLGAAAAFITGRYWARPWVEKRLEKHAKFSAVDKAVAREGWKIVLLTRLSPVFPFNLLNYAYGVTQVSFKDYLWASWIGMLPGTVMYVYLGTLAGDLATIGTGSHSRTAGEWVLWIAGLAATAAVTILITRIARKALNKSIER